MYIFLTPVQFTARIHMLYIWTQCDYQPLLWNKQGKGGGAQNHLSYISPDTLIYEAPFYIQVKPSMISLYLSCFRQWSICLAIWRHSSSRMLVVKSWIEHGVPSSCSKLSDRKSAKKFNQNHVWHIWTHIQYQAGCRWVQRSPWHHPHPLGQMAECTMGTEIFIRT